MSFLRGSSLSLIRPGRTARTVRVPQIRISNWSIPTIPTMARTTSGRFGIASITPRTGAKSLGFAPSSDFRLHPPGAP
jgi:hypothetical protein